MPHTRLLLYNPWNDLALASGRERYTPPAAAVAMARGGSLLPFWWADEGDSVMLPEENRENALALCRRYGLQGRPGCDADSAEPWGWSMATRHLLLSAGASPAILPDEARLDTLRALSHRRTAALILKHLGTAESALPVEARSTAEATDAIKRFDGRAVIKLPWSCSGRGVLFSRRLSESELNRRLEGMIRRQGSVMIEPEYEPVSEMAALFRIEGGRAALQGFSRFICSADGRYGGNILADARTLADEAGSDAADAAKAMEPILSQLIGPHYSGWAGVDMLRHSHGLNPCMELNLRMTMGVAAMYVARRLNVKGRAGVIYTAPGLINQSDIDLSPSADGMRVAVNCFSIL